MNFQAVTEYLLGLKAKNSICLKVIDILLEETLNQTTGLSPVKTETFPNNQIVALS